MEGLHYAGPPQSSSQIKSSVTLLKKEARWSFLRANARQPNISRFVDDAMVAIEKYNRSLRGVKKSMGMAS
jgi:type I restriction enzyme M protein